MRGVRKMQGVWRMWGLWKMRSLWKTSKKSITGKCLLLNDLVTLIFLKIEQFLALDQGQIDVVTRYNLFVNIID